MTGIPIVDTHLHIWDPHRLRYAWLDGVPPLNRPHLPADYRAVTVGINIEKMVFVQCEADFAFFREEVAWVTEQAAADPRIRGIVAWAPLEQGAGARGALAALAVNPLLVGIRRIIQFEADAGFCLRPDFVRGVQLLEEFDLPFELCIKGDAQFMNTLELVRKCPRVRFVLDHIGKPFIKEKIREPWASCLRELAALPNTCCKVSGLVNEAAWETWTPGDLQPYLDHVVACFGFDRLMFGGDWPVCTLASTYPRWFDTLLNAVSACTAEEKQKLFHDNAEKFYRV
ncbi:MAG: amidohydrolase family protein [Lentisphaerae bacterium]|nr:amidohydrolase family protein [Lentisphaerota bacterium]